MKKVLGLAACFNRKEKTVSAVTALTEGNPSLSFEFLIVDDGSTDGTREALKELDHVTVLEGDGSLYYSGGMRWAIEEAKKRDDRGYDYCLMFNDDVRFFPHCIEYLAEKRDDVVWVGPTRNEKGSHIYSGVSRKSRFVPKYTHLLAEDEAGVKCETLNGNCVLIPWKIFMAVPNIPKIYRHSFGDYEYGFGITRAGYDIMVPSQFAGICNDETKKENSWLDSSLPLAVRLQKKESVKGLPFREYFYYLHRNFSLPTAVVYSLSPYIKMIAGK
ncbi:MAG: glycosyltransferase family 2 protein [Solobacterium sp.]|nr:glycosyltransferase family 2 protein [Solobacterium sp.]